MKHFTNKGIERNDREQIIEGVKKFLVELGITVKATVESPIAGRRKGNKEYLLFLMCSPEQRSEQNSEREESTQR